MPHDADLLSSLVARIQRLEERVDERDAAARPGAPRSPTIQRATVDTDTFWILDGLEERHQDGAIAYAGSVDAGSGPVRWQLGHDARQLLELDWTTLAPSLGALGHPVRLHILQLVARGQAATAADLADTEGLGSTGQIYHHLRQLVTAGWLRATAKGRYDVPPERLVPLLVILAAGSP